MSLSLVVGFLLTRCPCPASKVSFIVQRLRVSYHHTRRSFKPRLHGELGEEDGGSDGEGVRRSSSRVQGGSVHAVVGSQPFRQQRSHRCDHTCACSAADGSMGVKFHSSKLTPEQVRLFRRIELEKVNKQLDGYVHQCSKMKVRCEKLVFEKEDVVDGLVEIIGLHRVTRLVISAAADRQYSRKMDKPKSRTATEIMQRADPSCNIWFTCKGNLICTRGKELDPAPSATPLLPDFDHQALQLVPYQKEDGAQPELGLYDELKEACIAAENLMRRALSESSRRQKADEEVVSALQKANEYQELYLEEVRKREELEEALARANREIAQLKQANHLAMDEWNTFPDELQEAMPDELTFERQILNMDDVIGTAGQDTESQKEHVPIQADLDTGCSELQALLSQSKLTASSPSSVIQSPYDEDCVPSYFLCPILQEPYRHVAADGFTYEGDAIRGWLDGGSDASSPLTEQPVAHRELAPNFALGAVIQDHTMRRRQHGLS